MIELALVAVTILLFDYEINQLIVNEKVSDESVEDFIKTIDNINTRGNTNIEHALKTSHEIIKTHNNPDIENIHIFMTDGLPTAGTKYPSDLAKLVLEYKLENIGSEHFIGFGTDHDSLLLESFAKIYDDSYHFIDSYENDERSERLSSLNLDEEFINPIDIIEEDLTTEKEAAGSFFGGILAFFFVMYVITGSMYPAIDLGAGEKERGTMETLISTNI